MCLVICDEYLDKKNVKGSLHLSSAILGGLYADP